MTQAKIIDGKNYAKQLCQNIALETAQLKEQHNIVPGLAVVLVGNDPASEVYVRNKGKKTIEVGMRSIEHQLPADIEKSELLALIDNLNSDKDVNGILVQLPLPKHIDELEVLNRITPEKDVDGFHVINAGRLSTNQPCIVPCTPLGCIMMLKETLGNLSGKHAVIIGRSNIVGKPMAQLLLQESCTVTITHSRTKDLEAECRRADIIVAAVGVEELVRGDWIKPGATIIDVGINRVRTSEGTYKLVGDVCFEEAANVAYAVTPVPGGVGPMTIACLLHNTLEVTCRQNGISFSRLALESAA